MVCHAKTFRGIAERHFLNAEDDKTLLELHIRIETGNRSPRFNAMRKRGYFTLAVVALVVGGIVAVVCAGQVGSGSNNIDEVVSVAGGDNDVDVVSINSADVDSLRGG